jgi:hypothetical protein
MAKELKADDRPQLFCANAISAVMNRACLSYVDFGSMFRQKSYYFDKLDWCLLKVSTKFVFINTPYTPRIVNASDPIRAPWVIA